MTMWKSERHLVQGRVDVDRVVLGSLTCISTVGTVFDFTQHHGMHGTFEVTCPICNCSETFSKADIVTEEDE
jgi:hypothetical protein